MLFYTDQEVAVYKCLRSFTFHYCYAHTFTIMLVIVESAITSTSLVRTMPFKTICCMI